jgi:amino acid transporter
MKKFLNKQNLMVVLALCFALSMLVGSVASAADEPLNTVKINADDLGIVYGKATGLGDKDLRTMTADIVRTLLGLLGIVAVVIILIGGFKWMTAMGEEEKVGEAKKLLSAGIIGLVIILCAYAIANFAISQLVEGTTVTSGT